MDPDHPHQFQVGDYVMLNEVKGMTEINYKEIGQTSNTQNETIYKIIEAPSNLYILQFINFFFRSTQF